MNWWDRPSTWAPQSGATVYSRRQDWALMAAADGDALDKAVELAAVAQTVGADMTAVARRMVTLVAVGAARHWCGVGR